ncbi:MAG: hypothetical protein WAK83_02345, partial [Trebonia sp.]|uniref:hypothetical protein n=1 Tax=Trebonia sp. TaxID=2767075 RepID=UPI003BAECA1B
MDSAWPFAVCPFTDGMSAGVMSTGVMSAGVMSAGADPSSLRKWMPCSGRIGCIWCMWCIWCIGCIWWIGCGMLGGVQDRSWDSAGALATMITPTTSATIP